MSKVFSTIGSIFGLGSNNHASDTAANYQTAGAQSAQDQLKDAQTKVQPYMDAGTQANTILQNDLSSGALGGNFAPGDLTKDPGYQFRLQQGQQALDRKAVGPGGTGYFSGGALKGAQAFGQGLADQTYNDAYNRWLQQQQNTYNILSGQSKQGLGASQQYGNYASDIGKYSSNIGDINSANTINKNNNQNKALGFLSGGF